MRNLVKYVGIGLLVVGLAACDNSDTKTPAQGASAESNATGQPVNLLDGKLSFSLPADMTDQSGKLGTREQHARLFRCNRAESGDCDCGRRYQRRPPCCPNVWKISSAAATRSCRW